MRHKSVHPGWRFISTVVHRTLPFVVMVLVGSFALAVPAQEASAKAPAKLTSCSFAALQTAVAGGGTIKYEQTCSVSFPTVIIFKGNADIEANGFGVNFDGAYGTNFFDLTGGKLTISGITMTRGGQTAPSGQNGNSGNPGTDGSNGSTESGEPGGSAEPSTPGTNGSNGTSASAVQSLPAEGGALQIMAGTMVLNDDSVSGEAVGGNGGTGGTGATGGGGGDGGNGSAGLAGLDGQTPGAGGLAALTH